MNSMQSSNKLARQLSSVRRKKIERLRSKIMSGKYRVDNLEIAKALFLAK